jgi:hypothetical protein
MTNLSIQHRYHVSVATVLVVRTAAAAAAAQEYALLDDNDMQTMGNKTLWCGRRCECRTPVTTMATEQLNSHKTAPHSEHPPAPPPVLEKEKDIKQQVL